MTARCGGCHLPHRKAAQEATDVPVTRELAHAMKGHTHKGLRSPRRRRRGHCCQGPANQYYGQSPQYSVIQYYGPGSQYPSDTTFLIGRDSYLDGHIFQTVGHHDPDRWRLLVAVRKPLLNRSKGVLDELEEHLVQVRGHVPGRPQATAREDDQPASITSRPGS